MNEELLSILRSARRKLVATRALESAAAMMILGAALCVTIPLVTLLTQGRSLGLGFLAGVAVAAILMPCIFGLARYLGGGRALNSPLLYIRVFILIGFFARLESLCAGLPKVVFPAMVVLSGAAIGAATGLLCWPDLRRVAVMVDAKAGLRERVSTAAELALSGQPLPPSAPVVFEQALAALREKRPHRLPMWSASRALPAFLGLALVMCLAVALMPETGPSAPRDRIRQFSQDVPTLTAEQRQRLAEAFREAAGRPSAAPNISAELLKAAAIVEVKDAQELQRILQKLQEAGYEPLGAVPPEVLAAAKLPAPSTPGEGPGGGRPGTEEAQHDGGPGMPRDANQAPSPAGSYVRVYDPRYAAFATRGGGGESNAPAGAPRATVPYADAWSAARAKALDDAERGDVPPAYRRLVRDFFASDP
jgi:hypothetical protein